MCGRILQWLISNPNNQSINQYSIFQYSVTWKRPLFNFFIIVLSDSALRMCGAITQYISLTFQHAQYTFIYFSYVCVQLSSCNYVFVYNYTILLKIAHHGTIVRLRWSERIIEIHYGDFLIFVSLIYFCFLYLFFSFSFLPMAHAEVEQKGKPINTYTHIHTCINSQPRLSCKLPAHHSRITSLLKSLIDVCMKRQFSSHDSSRSFHCILMSVKHSVNSEHILTMFPL